jgi:hypothetical protein
MDQNRNRSEASARAEHACGNAPGVGPIGSRPDLGLETLYLSCARRTTAFGRRLTRPPGNHDVGRIPGLA